MTLSELSIKNAVFAVMLMGLLLVFGYIGFLRLGVSQYPDVEFPIVTVSTTLRGAAPEVIESDISEVIEDAVSSVQGIRSITSSSVQGVSAVQIEFELNRDINLAVQDVRDKVSSAVRLLPRDIDPPLISKVNPQDSPIMWLGLAGQRSLQELSDYAEENLKPELQNVQGIGEIIVGGSRVRTIRIWADARKMEAYRLSADDLVSSLQRQHVELPGGRIESQAIEFNVRTVGEAISVEELNRLILKYENGSPIFLHQVAYVEDGLADRRSVARRDGLPSVGLGIRKQRGANTVAVADAVKAKLPELNKVLPEGMQLGISFDGSQFIKEAIDELKFTLILAVLFTAVVTLLFLGSLRSTIIIALAIPTSIVGTFSVMYFLGFTLNTMTLLALSLSVGVVVDDAILVLENIFRHRQRGLQKREAAQLGSREITFAAMAATIAVIAIFLPVAFMTGIIGRFFFEFGVTVSVAVLLSLLVALTLTPMLSSRFLTQTQSRFWIFRKTDEFYEKLSAGYSKLLPFTVNHRWIVVLATLIVVFLSFLLMGKVPKEFVPSQDQSRFMVNLETPVGSSVDYTNMMLLKSEKVLQEMPEIKTYFAAVGIGGAERGVNKAILFVTMVPKEQRARSQQDVLTYLRKELNSIPGMKAIPVDLSQTGFTATRGFPIEFAVRGPNLEKLDEYSGQLMAGMKEISGVVDIDSDFELGMPEVRVTPERRKAADVGVDMASIGRTVNTLIGGTDVAKFKDRGKRYDVRMRLVSQQRETPADIGTILIRNNRGQLIPLRDLADITVKPSLQVISRKDRQRAITVFANLVPGTDQQAVLKRIQELADKTLPEGYRISFTGSSQAFKESFQSLLFALFMGILIAYMVLGSQFNHFIHPVTVLVALPFSFTGAIAALYITGQSLNIFSMIGLILLMGLVKKNSIIMVDFTNHLRELGKDRNEALFEACPVRLRPILMTSISTIVGALPACLALGPGSESRMPMGIAVIGGLIFSTFLTLFVVPSVYTILDDLGEQVSRILRARREAKTVPAEAITTLKL